MDFDAIDLKKCPEPVKYFLCHLAARGWEPVEDGFAITVGGPYRGKEPPAFIHEHAAEVFPTAVWDADRLTVTGLDARKFMSLYRQAARGVRPVEEQFDDWLSMWIEREAEARSQLMRENIKKSRRDVRREALTTLLVAIERRIREDE